MIHSFDPYLWRHPEILQDIGHTMFDRYRRNEEKQLPHPLGPWFATTHRNVVNDTGRMYGFRLPPTVTWGYVVFVSTPMIHRHHLRHGLLEEHLVAALAARDPSLTGTTLVIPDALWRPNAA